jgi:hypothetical protein
MPAADSDGESDMRSILAYCLLTTAVMAADPGPVKMAFEDQFGKVSTVAGQQGKVLVLVYGDNAAVKDCRVIGEAIHLAFHPTAKGLDPVKAKQQPVLAMDNLPAGKAATPVMVQAVACCGKMPKVVKPVFLDQMKKASPEIPVWLDFEQTLTTQIGMTTGQANVAIFDVESRFRKVVNGVTTAKQQQEIIDTIQSLRVEAAK